MATVAQIRDGLVVRLATIDGLRNHATPPGQINPPATVVGRAETRYDVTFDGDDDHSMVIRVFVQFANNATAQEQLDGYLDAVGANSIVLAVHADPTLGGIVDYVRCAAAVDDGLVDYAGVAYLGGRITVEVAA